MSKSFIEKLKTKKEMLEMLKDKLEPQVLK